MFLHLPIQEEYALPNTAVVYFGSDTAQDLHNVRDAVYADLVSNPQKKMKSMWFLDSWLPGWYYWFFDHEQEFQPRVPTGPYGTAVLATQAALRKADWNIKRLRKKA